MPHSADFKLRKHKEQLMKSVKSDAGTQMCPQLGGCAIKKPTSKLRQPMTVREHVENHISAGLLDLLSLNVLVLILIFNLGQAHILTP